MSIEDDDIEVPAGGMLKKDAEELAVTESAIAINEFLYHLSFGNTPEVAFERAVDGETNIRLRRPSNVDLVVRP